MQKVIPLLLMFWANGLIVSAQDALDKEITVIVSDLVTKMKTKTTIKNVAIADFSNLNGTPTELGKYLAEQFSDVMVNANTSFSIVDRGRLNYLLKEAGLDAKGLLDPNSVAKLGKLKGIDAIVIGSMTSVGENLNVNVKTINLETAVILASAKGSLRRTPAIIELEKKELAPEPGGKTTPTKTNPAKPKDAVDVAPITFEKDPLKFECLECKQSGENVNCKFRITSVGKDIDLDIYIDPSYYYPNKGSQIIDEEGNDFFMINCRLANVSGGYIQKKALVKDVPISAEFTFSKVNRAINLITKMEINAAGPNLGYFTAPFKNIPVVQK